MGIAWGVAAARMVTQALSHWVWISFGLRQVCLCDGYVFCDVRFVFGEFE